MPGREQESLPTVTLAQGARAGDLRAALEAQRDHLADCLSECPADKVAPLHARLTDVLVRLATLEAPKEGSLDELARAREKRRTGS